MDVERILSLLPSTLLDDLAVDTQVNRYSKKLQGQVVFKLLIHCILSHKENSLRCMESAYESIGFSILNAGKKKRQVRYSSISERLSNINALYFENIYQTCIDIYGEVLRDKSKEFVLFDSTIVTLSSKLLRLGYVLKGDAKNTRQLKFTIGLSELPASVHFFKEQMYTSENVALREGVLSWGDQNCNPIRIFDRGITSRKTYDTLTDKSIPFISRINPNSKYYQYQENILSEPLETETLIIYNDQWVYLFSEGCVKATHPVRIIRGTRKETGEEIVFVTNVKEMPAKEVASLYKQRWNIEVFFKFLKQELNFSHLVNRSENGIRVMLYCTLIAVILLLVYKKKKKLTGYKIMKQRFVQDLEKSLVKNFVEMCGGNPKLVDKLLGFNTS